MCATSHPLAAKTAIDMLQRGGNAMDAAIAGAVLLGICEPQMTGIGGDCFVLFSSPGSEEISALNGSGRAPANVDADQLRRDGMSSVPRTGVHSVTLPGAVDAFCHLAETHGRLGLDVLLAPSIHYATEGVPVAPRVALDWPIAAHCLNEEARRHFLLNGQPATTGQIFRAPGQAEVLKRIAKHGRDAFYSGEVAEDMVDALQALGGAHTVQDFAATQCTPTVPIEADYKGLEVVEHPPNGQGATALLMLNMLKLFNLEDMDPFGAQRAHIEVEVAKLAYDARNRFIADPDHTARLDHMLSPETAARLAALVDPKRALPAPTPLAEMVHKDTVYITVVDRDRMAVSLIYSIFSGFGSGVASPKYGILLQNRGAGFNLIPGHPNELGGGKRPMHTIIPGMLKQDGRVVMPFGVMGGAYQPNGHARFVSNMVDFGLEPQAAIDAPRCFSDAGELRIERGYTDEVRQQLADMGHKIVIPEQPIGGAQAIRIHDSGVLEGASDARKDGCALGY
jgi:gamma-glutamyltranspeptidase/glutathione hydrolase